VTAVHYSPRLIMKIIINLGREILLLGSVRESIMKPSETSSGKKMFILASSVGDWVYYVEFHNILDMCPPRDKHTFLPTFFKFVIELILNR
jgi:hypothetical protein